MDWVDKPQNCKDLYGILQLLRGSHLNNLPLQTLKLGWVAFHSVKPRPNDCNMPTQHIATLLGATCCVRLATLLRHVGCCWLKFENGRIFHATFVDVAWCCSHWARFMQQCWAWACALVRFSTRNMPLHVATEWPNVQHVAPNNVAMCCVQCCDRLAGACKCWASNVGRCCVEILPSFGRSFRSFSRN